ncbi:formate dehydrogenase [Cupriavidus sp. WKF15]|uniref:formate dehydrogenase n=1 Tax=Cupriavidus sp. WKF15 TaxID=3032282 RepID=UPI0023E27F4E|nr:formate dehydrogenase [Cupriavidus sp. WKF15]WER45230.1 formate dehydrogenase [Cupriavidus sp. WKF15]
MREKQPRVARRTFLAGAGVVAAAAGAASLTARGPAAPVGSAVIPEPADVPSDSKGYRVSEHIRKYYRTTLV